MSGFQPCKCVIWFCVLYNLIEKDPAGAKAAVDKETNILEETNPHV